MKHSILLAAVAIQLIPSLFAFFDFNAEVQLALSKVTIISPCVVIFFLHRDLYSTDRDHIIITQKLSKQLAFASLLNLGGIILLMSNVIGNYQLLWTVLIWLCMPIFCLHMFIAIKIFQASRTINPERSLSVHYMWPEIRHMYMVSCVLTIPALVNIILRISTTLFYSGSINAKTQVMLLLTYQVITLTLYGIMSVFIIFESMHVFIDETLNNDSEFSDSISACDDDLSVTPVVDMAEFGRSRKWHSSDY